MWYFGNAAVDNLFSILHMVNKYESWICKSMFAKTQILGLTEFSVYVLLDYLDIYVSP